MSNEVKVNVDGLKKFRAVVQSGGMSGPIRKAINQWAARWRGAMQERFTQYSRGGGDWPALAASTIKRRRKGKRNGGLVAAILRDTGTMWKALTAAFVRAPGQLQEDAPMAVRVGFGGPSKHPAGGATVADIAAFHHSGAGALPERTIIDDPDGPLIEKMAGDMERALVELAAQTQIRK